MCDDVVAISCFLEVQVLPMRCSVLVAEHSESIPPYVGAFA